MGDKLRHGGTGCKESEHGMVCNKSEHRMVSNKSEQGHPLVDECHEIGLGEVGRESEKGEIGGR